MHRPAGEDHNCQVCPPASRICRVEVPRRHRGRPVLKLGLAFIDDAARGLFVPIVRPAIDAALVVIPIIWPLIVAGNGGGSPCAERVFGPDGPRTPSGSSAWRRSSWSRGGRPRRRPGLPRTRNGPSSRGGSAMSWPPRPLRSLPCASSGHPALSPAAKTLTDPGGKGGATLTMTSKGPSPAIVVDYGKDVGGVPYFVVRSVSGTPVLRSIYSEGSPVPGATGRPVTERKPGGRPFPDGRPDRGVSRATHHGPHPGWRALRTDHPDHPRHRDPVVDRHRLHRRPSHRQATSEGGSIRAPRSSTGSGTTGPTPPSSTSCPPAACPRPGASPAGRSRRWGAAPASCSRGVGWTDYSMSFDTRCRGQLHRLAGARLVADLGLPVHPPRGGRRTRSPDTLQEVAIGPGEFGIIDDVVLPETIVAGRWHHVTTVASGTDITTSIDGRQVATFDTSSLPSGASVYGSGTVGFETLGSTALFRDLDVTGAGSVHALRQRPVAVLGAGRLPRAPGHGARSPARHHGRSQARPGGVEWRPGRGGAQCLLHDRRPPTSCGGRSSCWAATRPPTASRARTSIPPSPWAPPCKTAPPTRPRTRWTRWTTSPPTTSTPVTSPSCDPSGR